MWRRIAPLLVAVVVLVTACRTDATVTVVVDDTGAGTVTVQVTMDDEVVAQLGDIETAIRLDDLQATGWTVSGPDDVDGATVVAVSKPFANPQEFTAVMAEVGSSTGVLSDFTYERQRSFGVTTYTIEGTLDLSGGLDAFGDDELTAVLGAPIGWTPEQVRAELGDDPGEAFTFTFRADLPGDISATDATIDGEVASWSPLLGDEPLTVSAEGSVDDRTPLLLAAVAFAAAVTAVIVTVLGWLRRRRRHDPYDRDPVPVTTAPAARSSATSGRPAVAAPGPERVLVVGGHGVLFTIPDVVSRLFGPFCREQGSRLPAAEISERYREATLGRLAPSELWPAVGVEGDVTELDRAYLRRVELDGEVADLLARVHDAGWATAVVINDVGVWSQRLRRRFHLDEVVDHWVASGDAGIRLPDPAVYELVRRRAAVSAADLVVLDTRLQFLDVAAALGATTVWLRPPADAPTDRGHLMIWSPTHLDPTHL